MLEGKVLFLLPKDVVAGFPINAANVCVGSFDYRTTAKFRYYDLVIYNDNQLIPVILKNRHRACAQTKQS